MTKIETGLIVTHRKDSGITGVVEDVGAGKFTVKYRMEGGKPAQILPETAETINEYWRLATAEEASAFVRGSL